MSKSILMTYYLKGSKYRFYKCILPNRDDLPTDVVKRIKELERSAIQNGILSYMAYACALKYVLENEHPLLFPDLDIDIPMRGYVKCIRIWRSAGLINSFDKEKLALNIVNSRDFENYLFAKGFPRDINLVNSVRKWVIDQIKLCGIRGSLRKTLHSMISHAISIYAGGVVNVR